MEALLDAWLPGGLAGSVCICLDDATWRAARARLAPVLSKTRMFPAVDVRGLLSNGVTAAVQRLQALPFRVSTQVMYDVCMRRSYKFLEHIVTPGAIGCAQSHLSIWAAFLNGTLACEKPDAEWLLVFESDVDPVPDCAASLHALIRSPKMSMSDALPACIRLGWSLIRPGTQTPAAHPAFNVFSGKTWYTHAYAIRKSALASCLAAMTPIVSQIDTAMGHAADLGLTPPQWIVRNKLFAQHVQHTLFHSTIRQGHLLRAALPESATATEAIIIVPYALVLALVIALIVTIVVMKKKQR